MVDVKNVEKKLPTWVDGIIVGAFGGTFAGIALWAFDYGRERNAERRDGNRVYKWLHQNTEDLEGKRFRTTRTIASYTDLSQDRVRFVCSRDPRIKLSTGQKEDVWGLTEIVRRTDPPLDSGI